MRVRAGILLSAWAVMACAEGRTTVREEPGIARFRVETVPPRADAKVYVNRSSYGAVPAVVELPYRHLEERVVSGHPNFGWAALLTGIGSGVATAVGVGAIESDTHLEQVLIGSTVGSLAVGLVILGITQLSAVHAETQARMDPAAMIVDLSLPGEGVVEVEIRSDGAHEDPVPYDQLRALRYDIAQDQWSAANLPAALKLVPRTRAQRGAPQPGPAPLEVRSVRARGP